MEFKSWPKIARYDSNCVITEKLDGTNAAIVFDEITNDLFVQSRTRFITPQDDNYGFARWVHENKESLLRDLGPGIHFGEWFGSGIQRNYGLKEKQFALFNTARFAEAEFKTKNLRHVPVLYEGPHSKEAVDIALDKLKTLGSCVNGFNRPEGVMVYFRNNNMMLKYIIDK